MILTEKKIYKIAELLEPYNVLDWLIKHKTKIKFYRRREGKDPVSIYLRTKLKTIITLRYQTYGNLRTLHIEFTSLFQGLYVKEYLQAPNWIYIFLAKYDIGIPLDLLIEEIKFDRLNPLSSNILRELIDLSKIPDDKQ